MVDIDLLKDKIKESGMTITAICNKSGMLRQTLYRRFDNPDSFTTGEIDSLSKTLRFTKGEVGEIFFANMSIKN